MNYILSIDVGIKNLSFCLFEKQNIDIDFNSKKNKKNEKCENINNEKCENINNEKCKNINNEKYENINNENIKIKNEDSGAELSINKIIEWEVINLIDTDEKYCLEINKNNIVCNNKAVFTKNNKCYCLKHSKKSDYMLPILELKKTKLNKLNLNQLKEISNKYYINFEMNIKKTKLIEVINNFVQEKTLEPIQINKCKDFDLITLSKTINKTFDILFKKYLNNLKCVCIELQMTSKMRSLSFIIMQYFLVNNSSIEIKMVSPCFKLKDLELEKTDYSTRKKNSIKHCQSILEKNENKKWISFFNKHKKKDDLSDCFLQGMYVLQKLC